MPGTIEKVLLILSSFNIENGKNNKLLNLGGGVGQVSDMMRNIGFNVYNLDLEVSKEDEFNVQHNLNDFMDLLYKDNSFDFILCQEVIEHIENPWKLFRDIRKILKHNGILIITTPNIQSAHSKRVFFKNNFGYFNWFKKENLSYHINPIPFWEIELIANKSNFSLNSLYGNGSYYFKKILSKEKLIKGTSKHSNNLDDVRFLSYSDFLKCGVVVATSNLKKLLYGENMILAIYSGFLEVPLIIMKT